ncbi:MAG TPA: M20/M25/M40 family metallo-hydrolase [Pilimelia sp.]|nr:M20/M25/M40 family metallo-hydrolase [Pilimelia sp.]
MSESRGYRKAITPANMVRHLQAFQSHAAGQGNRVAGSPAYEASASYVAARLAEVGYTVSNHSFDFTFNADATPPVLARLSAPAATYVDGVDFASMTYSPNGDVSAPLHAVDLVVPPGGTDNVSTSGCEAADFAGFPAGAIALIQRGTCAFALKAANAAAAGASAVVVFNEGQPGRTAALSGTLGGPQAYSAPVVGTSFEIGAALAGGVTNGATGVNARVRVDRLNEVRTTRNVIAERVGTDPTKVVVVGAHLDSVPRGPGINDNGTGSAAILEAARVMAQRSITPRNTVRFMWYGAEEFGLLGSAAYVSSLPTAEVARIKAMLNFDMIGSPNYVRFIYDGDNSAFPVGPNVQDGPDGSGAIEQMFADYFASQGLASAPTPFNGRSDYGPFITRGIPAGGLFTGAEGVKSATEAAQFGGTAGEPYDRCYHLACDDVANVNVTALDQMSDAMAHVLLTLAKRNFDKSPLVDPAPVAGGPATGGGGGLHDHDEEEA